MLLATTAFSVLSINLNALGGIWSRDIHQKTRITGTREAFGLVGLLIAVMLPSVLMQSMSKPETFAWVSVVLVIIMLISLRVFSRWLTHTVPFETESRHTQTSLWQTLRATPGNTRYFFLVYGVSMLASAVPAILVLFFIRDLLDAEAYTGLFLLLYFLSGAAGMPLWQRLSKQWNNKHRAWMAAMILAVVTFVWTYLLGTGDIWHFAVICMLSGICVWS